MIVERAVAAGMGGIALTDHQSARNTPAIAECARRVAVAAYELEINICIHSHGGVLVLLISDETITITAKDRGPGIPDIEWACRDGTSTANDWIRSLGFGAGMGLSNSKRVADSFDIQSEVGKFTKVTCTFNLNPPEAAAPAGGAQ